ncbi:hypothetical protein JXA80_05060, partial [bacterium]|nr:hypothetical protein [candidate division CSSED10-310 bacterium]
MKKTDADNHSLSPKQNRSTVKRFLVVCFKISVFVFAGLFISLLLIHVPPIQNQLGRWVIDTISRKSEKKIDCESFSVSLLGTITLNGICIGQNPLFGAEPHIRVRTLTIVFDPISLLSDKPHIHEIFIDEPLYRLIFREDKLSNMHRGSERKPRKRRRENRDDDQMIQAIFDSCRVDHIHIRDGHFLFQYAPSRYYLEAPDIFLEARYDPNSDSFRTRITGQYIHNQIKGRLESHADLRVEAEVWKHGVKHSIITATSNNGATWLLAQCCLENFAHPRLRFDGAIRSDLDEAVAIAQLPSDLAGPVDCFFAGNGLAEDLDITGICHGESIQFNRFHFVNFNGNLEYSDRVITIRDASGLAYNGSYRGTGLIDFSDTRNLDIQTQISNADLALVTEDLGIPLAFPSRCEASLRISGHDFKAQAISVKGFVSGTEYMDSESSDPIPMALNADFLFENGVFSIPQAELTHPYHQVQLHNGIFAKEQLAGTISGRTQELSAFFRRINRYTPLSIP